ncbi:MAG: glycosyltransferase [Holophagales bacterium]|nr:glycosyltransferase [Holophagales bacterium]
MPPETSPKPIRVAHLIHGLGLGGAQQVIRFLVRERNPDEFEHRVYTCHGGVFEEPIRRAGAEVRVLPRRIPKFDPFWVGAMARAMRDDAIDLVHGHLFGDTLHGYLAAKRVGLLPMVMTLHNTVTARTRLQLRGYRWLLGRRTVPVACAGFVRTSFLEHMGAVAEPIRAIENGISAEDLGDGARQRARRMFAELGVPGDSRVFGTVGRLAEQKAYPLLFQALTRAPESPPIHLLMLGDGPLAGDLQQRVVELGLEDRVTFAGFRNDVPRLLPGLDALVFSSRFEGLPMALLEAMSAGLPTVATRVGGMPEALDDGESGLLVPAGDAEALADAMGRLAGDAELRRRLGRGARERFERDFTARAMTRRYEELYREVMAARSGMTGPSGMPARAEPRERGGGQA